MNKKTDDAIYEARQLMKRTAPRRDIRIPLLKIAVLAGLLLSGWCYHDYMAKRIEFLEAATADLNIRLYEYGVIGGLR